MSSYDNSIPLLQDRISFRLYAAEQHLIRLKEIERLHGDIAKVSARLAVEMEIDCLLAQIVGAVDSLLYLINSRLDLGVRENQVKFPDVQSALSAKTKQIGLLAELDYARQPGNWYSILNELRNQSMHRSFLKLMTFIDINIPNQGKLKFLKFQRDYAVDQDEVIEEEVIPYLEKSLERVKAMINDIKQKEPLLM
jgi:hypothetical protein